METRLSDEHRHSWAEYVSGYEDIPLSAITMAEQEPTAVYLTLNGEIEILDSVSGFFCTAWL